MPAGEPTSFRLTSEAVQMLKELESCMGLKRTGVVERAIRLLYRAEVARKKSEKIYRKPS